MNRHLGLLGLIDPDSLCRFCEENDETPWHLIYECPVFEQERRYLSQVSHDSRGELGPKLLSVLKGFLLIPSISALFEREDLEQNY